MGMSRLRALAPDTRPPSQQFARSLSGAKRLALQRKLLAAESKRMSPKKSRGNSGNRNNALVEGQVEQNVFARWKSLRGAWVAVDKNRKGRVNPKVFLRVMKQNAIGSAAEIRDVAKQWTDKAGVRYNDFIRATIQQFAQL